MDIGSVILIHAAELIYVVSANEDIGSVILVLVAVRFYVHNPFGYSDVLRRIGTPPTGTTSYMNLVTTLEVDYMNTVEYHL